MGVVRSYKATGNLTIHGQTHTVSFALNAERISTLLEVQGDITVLFSKWGIANPSFGTFVKTASSGTLEFLLHLLQGAAASTSPTTAITAITTSSSTAPGGGPTSGSPSGAPLNGGGGGSGITVPATTTPPLSIGG